MREGPAAQRPTQVDQGTWWKEGIHVGGGRTDSSERKSFFSGARDYWPYQEQHRRSPANSGNGTSLPPPFPLHPECYSPIFFQVIEAQWYSLVVFAFFSVIKAMRNYYSQTMTNQFSQPCTCKPQTALHAVLTTVICQYSQENATVNKQVQFQESLLSHLKCSKCCQRLVHTYKQLKTIF